MIGLSADGKQMTIICGLLLSEVLFLTLHSFCYIIYQLFHLLMLFPENNHFYYKEYFTVEYKP